jgi:hypothetical protein
MTLVLEGGVCNKTLITDTFITLLTKELEWGLVRVAHVITLLPFLSLVDQ